MKEMKIRGIEDAVYLKLKAEATRRNMGMETLVRNLIKEFTMFPDIKSVEDKYAGLANDMITMYRQLQKDTIDAVERNSILIDRLLEDLEERV